MHQSDREQLWIQIDRINERLGDLVIQRDNPSCTCEERECDECAITRAVERDIEQLQRDRHSLLQKLPEVRHGGFGHHHERA